MLKVPLAKMHCMRILLLADSDLITQEKIKYQLSMMHSSLKFEKSCMQLQIFCSSKLYV